MKKFAALSVMAILALTLSACATTSGENVRVKCPSCGYQFDVETKG